MLAALLADLLDDGRVSDVLVATCVILLIYRGQCSWEWRRNELAEKVLLQERLAVAEEREQSLQSELERLVQATTDAEASHEEARVVTVDRGTSMSFVSLDEIVSAATNGDATTVASGLASRNSRNGPSLSSTGLGWW